MAVEANEEAPFGPYLVYERLGIGGMATVHRARERGIEGFERIVALKRLLPHLAEDASFIKAFVREAKLASALNHVNIVQIFELGRVGTEYFISMEYIDGRDIRRILRHARKVTGPPPIGITLGLLIQLCDALDYAHTKADEHGTPMQVVHRDVSPSNVLVTSGGHVKVIDFGIAKAQSSQLRTQTGRVKGKLAYMAPEAISGKDLDARSDVFAVGVIAHELLTARPLFASKNEYQTLLKVQRGDILPPSTFNQSCYAELDAIVLRALARDPDDRYSSAAALRDDLVMLRRKHGLATGVRDIATWLDWAFSLEAPSGGFAGNTGDQHSMSLSLDRSPVREGLPVKPRSASELDDAVEVAWGVEHEEAAKPVVLDDVPDVSDKHVAPPAHKLFEDDEDDVQVDLGDDIPTPAPSHGPAPRRSSQPPQRNSLLDALLDANEAAATMQELPVAQPQVPLNKQVATKPGVIPALARTAAMDEVVTKPRPAPQVEAQPTHPPAPKGPRRTWVILAGIAAAGTVATAATLFITRGDQVQTVTEESEPRVAPKTIGTVKFNLEPADAEIVIGGKVAHAGSPFQTELEAGVHQIQISREGYKSWLTALELSASETQTLRVVLEPLGAAVSAREAEATLILTSTPSGLEAMLDGKILPVKTPIKMPIKIGPHTIVLRQNGEEVWRQDMVAQANAEHEFAPSMDADKKRERAERRVAPRPAPQQPAQNDLPSVQQAVQQPPPKAEPKPQPTPPTPQPTPVEPPPKPAITAPVVAPTTPVVVAQPPKQVGPATIPSSKVTKLSGDVPELSKTRHADIPAVVAAKLCIDTRGKVTSADLITKLEPRAALEMVQTLKAWRYAPYKPAPTAPAAAACFALSFRSK